jgi:hypothetical protein
MGWKYYILMKIEKLRLVETILRMEERGYRRMMEGINLTKIYCKHFCECHNVLPVKQYMIIKINK